MQRVAGRRRDGGRARRERHDGRGAPAGARGARPHGAGLVPRDQPARAGGRGRPPGARARPPGRVPAPDLPPHDRRFARRAAPGAGRGPGGVRRGAAAPPPAGRGALRRSRTSAPQFMGTPPLRSLEHRDALWAGAGGPGDRRRLDRPRAAQAGAGRGGRAAAPRRDERGRGAAGPDAHRRRPRRSHHPSPLGRALLHRARTPARAPAEGTPGAGLRRRHRALRPGGRVDARCRRCSTPPSTTPPTRGCACAAGR